MNTQLPFPGSDDEIQETLSLRREDVEFTSEARAIEVWRLDSVRNSRSPTGKDRSPLEVARWLRPSLDWQQRTLVSEMGLRVGGFSR